MAAFATVDDYAERYGEPGNRTMVAARLADASGLLEAAWVEALGSEYSEGASAQFDRNAAGVCCAMVNRAMSAPAALGGASQYSQGAGSYTASVSFANPTGDLYLTRGDRMALGLSGCSPWSLAPRSSFDETE